MKKKKKVFCMLIVLIMILQSFAYIQVFAAEATESPEIYQIADFGTLEGIQKSEIRRGTAVTASVEQAYDDANTSLKLDVQKLTTGIVKTDGLDWSEYKYFRMRIYADKTGDAINIIPLTLPSANLNNNPYMYKNFTINQTGWHDVTLDLSSFTKNAKPLAAGESNHTPEWSEMTSVYFAIGEWGTAYTPGSAIYIDEIWLEKDSVSYETENSQIKAEDKVLANYNSLASAYSAGLNPHTTKARNNGNEVYATWEIPALKLSSKYLYNDSTAPLDLSSYKYINLWVYSPRAQDGGILIVFKEGSSLKVHTLCKTVDWKGWKLFSVGIDEYKNVSQIYLCANGWPNGPEVPGWQVSRWFGSGLIGIEKVWLSATVVIDPNAISAPGSAGATEFAPDAYLANEFSSTANLKDKGGAALENVVSSVDNNNNYGMTARFKWDVANSDKTQKSGYVFEASSNDIKNTKISPDVIKTNDYNYANFLVYNPGKKLKDNTTSALNFIALYGTAPDNATFSGGYSLERVPMDWTGWKVVSIPLDAKADTNGIYSLYVNAGGWSTSGWADIGNYIDVDSVWLSKEAYADNAFVSSTVADGATNVPVVLDGNNTITYTFTNYISPKSESEVTVYKNYVPVDSALYTVEIEGKEVSIIFNESLNEKSIYTVKMSEKFADAYGVKLGKALSGSFTTEDLYVNSDVLTVENGIINGFKGMTLADVRGYLTYSDDAVLSFKNSTGVIADETKLAESGMYAVISKRGTSKEFKLGIAFSNADNFKYFINGVETKDAFEIGTLKVTADAYCYTKNAKAPMTLIIAQYEGDVLVNVNYEPYKVSGKEEISAEIELEKVAGTQISVFVWDSLATASPVIKSIRHNVGNSVD